MRFAAILALALLAGPASISMPAGSSTAKPPVRLGASTFGLTVDGDLEDIVEDAKHLILNVPHTGAEALTKSAPIDFFTGETSWAGGHTRIPKLFETTLRLDGKN